MASKQPQRPRTRAAFHAAGNNSQPNATVSVVAPSQIGQPTPTLGARAAQFAVDGSNRVGNVGAALLTAALFIGLLFGLGFSLTGLAIAGGASVLTVVFTFKVLSDFVAQSYRTMRTYTAVGVVLVTATVLTATGLTSMWAWMACITGVSVWVFAKTVCHTPTAQPPTP